jgi:hypothetical protein
MDHKENPDVGAPGPGVDVQTLASEHCTNGPINATNNATEVNSGSGETDCFAPKKNPPASEAEGLEGEDEYVGGNQSPMNSTYLIAPHTPDNPSNEVNYPLNVTSADNSQSVRGDTNSAITFLQNWCPQGPWTLTAISERHGTFTRAFTSLDDARKFIDEHNGNRNLYFQVNSTIGLLTKKSSKADIAAAEWLHVDIDANTDRPAEAILADIQAFHPKPTAIVFSGGGYQAFWRLAQPYRIDGKEANWLALEAYNRALAKALGGDNCHNVDRIMRLPGTVNIPTKAKLAKGRVNALARLVEFSDATYPLSAFKPEPVELTGKAGDAGHQRPMPSRDTWLPTTEIDDLDQWQVSDRLKEIMACGQLVDRPKPGDNSRSVWLLDFLCGMLRKGVPDVVILGIATDKRWLISASVLEGRTLDAANNEAWRQLQKARNVVARERPDSGSGVLTPDAALANAERRLCCCQTIWQQSSGVKERFQRTMAASHF